MTFTHFVPVVPGNPTNPNDVSYYPCPPNQNNLYTEVVTFESASCLPRYLVELQPNLVKSLVLQPPVTAMPSVISPAISPNIAPVKPPVLSPDLPSQEGEQAYRTGMKFYVACQYPQALRYFEQSAASDYPAACLYLYLIYSGGMGVSIDGAKRDFWGEKVARHLLWFKKQAETGQAEAQLNLGFCYEIGRGVTEDLTLAAKHYQLAADQGNALAQFHLGVCYQNGQGVTKDLTLAVRYYKLAADQGHATAQNNLGKCYKNGQGVTKDLALAAKYYQLAADQGDADAQTNLGFCYQTGQGVTKDLTLAIKYYQLAADQGHALAQCNLLRCWL